MRPKVFQQKLLITSGAFVTSAHTVLIDSQMEALNVKDPKSYQNKKNDSNGSKRIENVRKKKQQQQKKQHILAIK